jgi:hypothetical protein
MVEFTEDMVKNAIKQLGANKDTNIEQYQEQVLDTYQVLLDKVTTENELIEKSYPGISVAGRKSIYLDQSSTIFIMINKWLFWIYIALAIILSIMIILKPFSIYFKISMIAVIIAFPFYIYPLETGLYELLIYIYSVLLSVIYNNGYKIK